MGEKSKPLMLILCLVAWVQANGGVEIPRNYWEWDSLRVYAELRTLEYRILEESPSNPEIIAAWNMLLLEFNMFEYWIRADSIRAKSHQIEAFSSPALRTLYSPHLKFGEDPAFVGLISIWGQDRFSWELAQSIHAFHGALERSNLGLDNTQSRLQAIERERNLRFDFTPILLSLSGLLFLVLVIRIFSNRMILFPKANVDKDPPIVRKIRELIAEKRGSSDLRLSITELELILFKDSIVGQLKDAEQWNVLGERQQLLLFLMVRGHGLDECARYLGLSKGHVYNQRTELRRIFGLNEGADLDQVWRD